MKSNCIKNKELISNFAKEMTGISQTQIRTLLNKYYDVNAIMYMCHPFNVVEGIDSMLKVFYHSFLDAFDIINQTPHHIIADFYKNEEWVSVIGTYKLKFHSDWIGIKATAGDVDLNYGAFHRIRDGKIVETRMLIDLLELLYRSDPKSLLKRMPFKNFISSKMSKVPEYYGGQEDLIAFINIVRNSDEIYEKKLYEHFIFHGFSGFGTLKSKKSYLNTIHKPFRQSHKNLCMGHNDASVLSDDMCVCMTGWPGIEGFHYKSGWLNTKAVKKDIHIRIMEWWFIKDGAIYEKRVLIDQIDYLLQLGIDILEIGQTSK